MGRNLSALRETQVQFLSQKDPLQKEMETHSSILAWEIQWTGRLQSMGLQRVGHNWAAEHTHMLNCFNVYQSCKILIH